MEVGKQLTSVPVTKVYLLLSLLMQSELKMHGSHQKSTEVDVNIPHSSRSFCSGMRQEKRHKLSTQIHDVHRRW